MKWLQNAKQNVNNNQKSTEHEPKWGSQHDKAIECGFFTIQNKKKKSDALLFEFDVKVLADVVHTHTANTNCCSCHSLSE